MRAFMAVRSWSRRDRNRLLPLVDSILFTLDGLSTVIVTGSGLLLAPTLSLILLRRFRKENTHRSTATATRSPPPPPSLATLGSGGRIWHQLLLWSPLPPRQRRLPLPSPSHVTLDLQGKLARTQLDSPPAHSSPLNTPLEEAARGMPAAAPPGSVWTASASPPCSPSLPAGAAATRRRLHAHAMVAGEQIYGVQCLEGHQRHGCQHGSLTFLSPASCNQPCLSSAIYFQMTLVWSCLISCCFPEQLLFIDWYTHVSRCFRIIC